MGRGWWYKTLWETATSGSDKVFEKEVICHEFDFKTSDLEFEVPKSSIWKHTTSCDHGATQVFFLSLISRDFEDWLSSNFHRFVILFICWDTSTVKTSLWQLPIVSIVFKPLRAEKQSGCLSMKQAFLLRLTHTLLLFWEVEQRTIPTALFHVVHLFETSCLVHVSLHPTI